MEDKYVWVLVQEKPKSGVEGVWENKSDLEDYVRGRLLGSITEEWGSNYEFRTIESRSTDEYIMTSYDYDVEYRFYTVKMKINRGLCEMGFYEILMMN